MAEQYHTLPEGQYSKGEEVINCITHGIGMVLSIAGLVYLIHQALNFGTTWHLVTLLCTAPR